MSSYPSIFNDVIGPVMRGPSSSHCAASLRIARMCRDLMNGSINNILIEFDPEGSLATTHKSQGSDMGLFGGFLGWEADDERLPNSEEYLLGAGISYSIEIHPLEEKHPNTYQITLENEVESHQLIAISTGGGMIEVLSIDGTKVSMAGDYHETLVFVNEPETALSNIKSVVTEEVLFCKGKPSFVEIRTRQPLEDGVINQLAAMDEVSSVKRIAPVLPILARKKMNVPFISCTEMMEYNKGKNKQLWQLASVYEVSRGSINEEEVFEKMRNIIRIMRKAIETGVKGTNYEDRILDSQAPQFDKSAGSCGGLPGVVFAVGHSLDVNEDALVKAMLSAGLIGVFIANRATFAAEVGGCMAETGSGGGMAAAALVGMKGGSLEQSIAAASLALQNSLGIVCDPIGNRVEAPCLGRNVMAASNAIACANMALSDYAHLIPLDEVIDTMKEVGDRIHHTLRCTNLGGLSTTPTAKKIEQALETKGRRVFKSC